MAEHRFTPGPWAVRTIDMSLGSVETADGAKQIAQAQEVSVEDPAQAPVRRFADAEPGGHFVD